MNVEYTLDTNIITALLKWQASAWSRLNQALHVGQRVTLNALSYYETKRGLLAVGAQKQLARFEQLCHVHEIVMLDQAALDQAAVIYADLQKKGMLIEDADLLMAAIALVNDLTLVTNTTKHFSRIPGLRLEDWLAP